MECIRNWIDCRKLTLILWWLRFQLAVEQENLRVARLRVLKGR